MYSGIDTNGTIHILAYAVLEIVKSVQQKHMDKTIFDKQVVDFVCLTNKDGNCTENGVNCWTLF